MIWCTINKDYISFLKNYDSRIPNIDYGNNGYKPFFSPLFEKDGLVYVTQVSSKKPRHLKMKESIDFVKIFYKNIDNFRTFSSLDEKNKYIDLLRYEMKVINNKNIQAQALKVYTSISKNSFLKNRCLPFLLLEKKAIEYSKEKQFNCITGNRINIYLHSSGENKNLSDDEKLYQIPITYYNISDLKITKEIEQKFVPMKEKEKIREISKSKGQGIGD